VTFAFIAAVLVALFGFCWFWFVEKLEIRRYVAREYARMDQEREDAYRRDRNPADRA
jgi:hypothetical protein